MREHPEWFRHRPDGTIKYAENPPKKYQDIYLHAFLQEGGRPAFQVRLVLAATLGASYGIDSGFELCENRAVAPGSEEYLDSEKYQIVHRDWDRPGHIKDLVTQVNRIRRERQALQYLWSLTFHEADNDHLLCYSKGDVMVVVNLDTAHLQHGWIKVPLHAWRLPLDLEYNVRDLLTGEVYRWRGEWNYVRLDPTDRVAHILTIA